jgi:uncharacterized membrane protein YhaH (DUF805 family)
MGRGRRAYTWFVAIWLAVFIVQTIVLLRGSETVRDRTSGGRDPGYIPVVSVIFLAGLGIVYLSATIRARRGR